MSYRDSEEHVFNPIARIVADEIAASETARSKAHAKFGYDSSIHEILGAAAYQQASVRAAYVTSERQGIGPDGIEPLLDICASNPAISSVTLARVAMNNNWKAADQIELAIRQSAPRIFARHGYADTEIIERDAPESETDIRIIDGMIGQVGWITVARRRLQLNATNDHTELQRDDGSHVVVRSRAKIAKYALLGLRLDELHQMDPEAEHEVRLIQIISALSHCNFEWARHKFALIRSGMTVKEAEIVAARLVRVPEADLKKSITQMNAQYAAIRELMKRHDITFDEVYQRMPRPDAQSDDDEETENFRRITNQNGLDYIEQALKAKSESTLLVPGATTYPYWCRIYPHD